MSSPFTRAELIRIESELRELFARQVSAPYTDERAISERIQNLLDLQQALQNGTATPALILANGSMSSSSTSASLASFEPIAVAADDSAEVRAVLPNVCQFDEEIVRETRDRVVWRRTNLGAALPIDAGLQDWAKATMRDALYRQLFFGDESQWRLAPDWWRLVFCDAASARRQPLAVGTRSGLRWPMSANGANYAAHRLGFRATGQEDVMFDTPDVRRERELGGRSFAYQRVDSLCAMHALNNVGRSFVLTPPTYYATIFNVADPHDGSADLRWFRERVNIGGTDGDLVTAALRRGVLLARVVVRNIFDIDSLRAETSPLELLARRNGGVIVMAPRGGHYVPLLPDGTRWTLLNDRAPLLDTTVLSDTSFAGVLRAYYLTKLAVWELDESDLRRTEARLRAQTTQSAATELRLLVPLHFVPQLRVDTSPLDRLVNHWARYVVCNTTALVDNVNLPEADQVLAINYANTRLEHAARFARPDERPSSSIFSQLLAQTYVELELNEIAERLAAVLIAAYPGRQQQVDRASLEEIVTQARRVLITQRALGLLLDPASTYAPLSNREWLRFVALHVVVANDTITRAPRYLLFLLMNCLFTDHRVSGDVPGRYPSIVRIWSNLRVELALAPSLRDTDVLPMPRGSLPHERAIILLLFTLPPSTDWNFFQLTVLREVSFDRSLWLLSAFVDAFPQHGIDRPTLAELQPTSRVERIRTEDPRSDANRYVELMRDNFFRSTLPRPSALDADVAAQFAATPRKRELFALPQFGSFFNVIAAPERLVSGDPAGTPDIPWETLAEIAAADNGWPQLLLRFYTVDGLAQLDGSYFNRRNARVDPRRAPGVTTRFDAASGTVASSPEPVIAFDSDY